MLHLGLPQGSSGGSSQAVGVLVLYALLSWVSACSAHGGLAGVTEVG